MRKSAKIITALSVSGLAVVAGSAFTGAGLTTTAGVSQFVGGEVSQTVDGAELKKVEYFFVDPAQTTVDSVDLTLSAQASGKTAELVLAHSGGVTGPLECNQNVDQNDQVILIDGNAVFTCAVGNLTGITAAKVTVESVNVTI
jgi:hypothetical protein